VGVCGVDSLEIFSLDRALVVIVEVTTPPATVGAVDCAAGWARHAQLFGALSAMPATSSISKSSPPSQPNIPADPRRGCSA